MYDVWYAIPTANADKARTCFRRWREQGYRCAALTDAASLPGVTPEDIGAELGVVVADYPGWATAVCMLCEALPLADIVVTGGDDQDPDPWTDAQEAAAQFAEHFGPDLLGVMQPTGDGFCGNGMAAVSPWLGRGWIDRAYGGRGPLWRGYTHFCADTELRAVAVAAGLYWERVDLSQYHHHWTREPEENPPAYRAKAQAEKGADHALMLRRRAANWPGSEIAPAHPQPTESDHE